MGLTLRCPCKPDCQQRLAIWFANPVDGGSAAPLNPDGVGNYRWQRVGDTFETLSLHPSVDFSKVGHWHGHISNGNVT